MAEEQNPWLQAFESQVRSYGPEVAFRNCAKMFGEAEALKLKHAYERRVGLITELPGSPRLQERRFDDWYAGPGDDDQFWPVLKRFLLEKKKWPATTVDSLDTESTAVMRMLQPVFGPVDIKGLVVGYVQSGKTANYSALIAKAADVGYRLIIVLAGIHNGLRRQTQMRLQAELIESDERIKTMWHTLTWPHEDFRARGTNTDAFLSMYSSQRILLVVKKNQHVLSRLIKWLAAAQPRLLEQCPALIIDDEADQASVNTGKAGEDERTAINKSILTLKKTLPKSAYVGYTATPFANVLMDPSGQDLYPSDFIVALRKPPNYFGAELFFGREPLENEDAELPKPPDMFREVNDDEVPLVRPATRAAAAAFAASMPPSLRTAIEYFLMATAARWARGHRMKHSSMLVHTAMAMAVHKNLAACVRAEVNELAATWQQPKVIERLRVLWQEEHAKVRRADLTPVPFDAVASQLAGVFDRVQVVVDNSQSDSRLVYKEENELEEADKVVHIAVGGNTLSRGLTLEGLIVSYFVRSATTYDTLLQMGRWFGYRFGYEDLPRLWMTDELKRAFRDLATVEEEIRNDIARYEEEHRTPREFAVSIRTHPTMAVTSRLKMQYAVPVRIDYTGFTRQTTIFHHRNDAWLRENWAAGAALVERVAKKVNAFAKKGKAHWFAKGVAAEDVLAFLEGYRCHEDHTDLRRDFVRKYIEKQCERGECRLWTVGVVTLADDSQRKVKLGGLDVAPVIRSKLTDRGDGVDLGTITTQANFNFDLSDEQRAREPAEKNTRKQPKRPPGSEPLLLLVPIDKESEPRKNTSAGAHDDDARRARERYKLDAVRHVLGIALAFPGSATRKLGENYIQVELPEQAVLPDDGYVETEEVTIAEDDG